MRPLHGPAVDIVVKGRVDEYSRLAGPLYVTRGNSCSQLHGTSLEAGRGGAGLLDVTRGNSGNQLHRARLQAWQPARYNLDQLGFPQYNTNIKY